MSSKLFIKVTHSVMNHNIINIKLSNKKHDENEKKIGKLGKKV